MESKFAVTSSIARSAANRGRQSVTVVVATLSAVSVSYSLVLSLVNPALQPLRAQFHASQAGIGWGSGRTIGLFAAAVAAGTAWVAIELRSESPLIDMRIMRLPPVRTANLASLLFGVGLYSAMGYLPSFLQTPASAGYGFGASITTSGLTPCR